MAATDPVVHDIVGGGGAGLRAAVAAVEEDPKLTIAVASKVYLMRSHTVSAEGGSAGVVRTDNGDGLDLHAYDTIKGSDFIPDQDVGEVFVREAPGEMIHRFLSYSEAHHPLTKTCRNDQECVRESPERGSQVPPSVARSR